MTIFVNAEIETTVQVNDRTRIDASKTYVTPNEEDGVVSLQIKPDALGSGAGTGWFDVVDTDKYLDWEYSSSGTKTIYVRGRSSGAYVTKTLTLPVITAADDKLFSNDQNLKMHEPDVLKYVLPGKNTFINTHRRVQTLILDYLDQKGYTDTYNNRLTKDNIVVTEEIETWATFMALRIIFEGLSNAIDDIFAEKSKRYEGLERASRDRAVLRLDIDGDGTCSAGEETWISQGIVVRR